MKAFCLWQPWASLWLSPRKIHETRSWATSHRGWLLVHAAKRAPDAASCDDELDRIVLAEFNGAKLPLGMLIGMVNLVGCEPTGSFPIGHSITDDYHCGDFTPGRYAWRRAAYKLFDEPIPYRGAQSIFEVPDHILAEVA